MKTSRTQIASRIQTSSRTQTFHAFQRLAAALVLFGMLITGLPALAAETPDSKAPHPGVVNINTADADQLKQLPRVGPALADRIMAYRENNGEFTSTDDLILVQGIGEKTYSMLRTFVVVEGKTTLSRKLKTSDVPAAEGSSPEAAAGSAG